MSTSYAEPHLLAFVKDNQHDLLSIHFDLKGLDYFISQLQHIRSKLSQDEVEHAHFFSKEWGDGALSISTRGSSPGDGSAIHQVNAYGWPDSVIKDMAFEKS